MYPDHPGPKGAYTKWRPLFRRVSLPVTCRVRLGRRFDPPGDARGFTALLEAYFREEPADAPQNRWLEARAQSARRAQ